MAETVLFRRPCLQQSSLPTQARPKPAATNVRKKKAQQQALIVAYSFTILVPQSTRSHTLAATRDEVSGIEGPNIALTFRTVLSVHRVAGDSMAEIRFYCPDIDYMLNLEAVSLSFFDYLHPLPPSLCLSDISLRRKDK